MITEPDREIFQKVFLSEKINDIADNMEIKNNEWKRLPKANEGFVIC